MALQQSERPTVVPLGIRLAEPVAGIYHFSDGLWQNVSVKVVSDTKDRNPADHRQGIRLKLQPRPVRASRPPTRTFKAFGNRTRKQGMSWELLRLQSLAHASGFQILCQRSFETASTVPAQTLKNLTQQAPAFTGGIRLTRFSSETLSDMSARTCLSLAAALAFLAVVFGAFGAHGLSGSDSKSGYLERRYSDMQPKNVSGMQLPPAYKYLQDFRPGVRYHMWHSLALFGVGLLIQRRPSRLLSAAAWCFIGGIVFFSGALYVLVICGPKFGGITWGMIAPIGGTLQLVGWALLTVAVLRTPDAAGSSATPTI